MTDEACANADEFYARFRTMSMSTFTKTIQTYVHSTKEPHQNDLGSLIPYSSVCWLPVARTDPSSADVHVFQRRATRCLGCTEYNEMFIWEEREPTLLLGCMSAELGFVAHFHDGWRTRFWVDGTYVAPTHPVVHDVITRTALVSLLPSVVPPFYAFGCADRGVVVEWMPEFAEEIAKQWQDMQVWLDALESVQGFLVAPSATLFDAYGRIHDLSTLCWTHTSNPKVRWMAPMRTHPTRMQVPEGGVDATDLKGMRSWQRWFYEAVRGQPTTGKTLTVRRWNTWITWCSLAMSDWPEGQAAVLAPVVPKEPLRSPEACLAYLLSP